METISLQGQAALEKTLTGLQRGIQYEIRLSARNRVSFGQEAVKYYVTPEAAPSGPPLNISER